MRTTFAVCHCFCNNVPSWVFRIIARLSFPFQFKAEWSKIANTKKIVFLVITEIPTWSSIPNLLQMVPSHSETNKTQIATALQILSTKKEKKKQRETYAHTQFTAFLARSRRVRNPETCLTNSWQGNLSMTIYDLTKNSLSRTRENLQLARWQRYLKFHRTENMSTIYFKSCVGILSDYRLR